MATPASVIYANSVLGARSNFEGGPSALAAALTGRTPRYGYHLDEAAARPGGSGSTAHAARPQRMGRARRHRRRGLRLLLGGSADRGARRRSPARTR